MGIEPTTFSLGSSEGADVTEAEATLTTSANEACTGACTTSRHDDSAVTDLARRLRTVLRFEDRAELARLLLARG